MSSFVACARKTGAVQRGTHCKDSLPSRQAPATIVVTDITTCSHLMTNPTLVRRRNVLSLFQSFAEKALAAGEPPKGLEQAFAASLQISPSMWSQIKSSRPIGDKLARQIERHSGRDSGWLDIERSSTMLTPAETSFLELALAAYRASNASGRRSLRQSMKAVTLDDPRSNAPR
ncbi:MAG: hypothetical protein R3E87_20325 [Burkholderiaceae bacterium]